ncbi:hypothetical protein CDD83_2161 [Cordyceps sp. RAO-2017]|nr:hypothetical protein CDD83_2161 [Cordyceps sp. RAO-2017]
MLTAQWICRSCVRALRCAPQRQFVRQASNDTRSPSALAPGLLLRARSLTAEHNSLQTSLHDSFDAAKAKRAGELHRVAAALREWEEARSSIAELEAMAQDASQDADLASIARDELQTEQSRLEMLQKKLSVSLTPRHPFADMPCMIEVRPGPGGLEGRYFADSVFKMYKGLCARRGLRANVLKYELSDASGEANGEMPLQEAVLEVKDAGAYDAFRCEAGIHRVQRRRRRRGGL